VTSVLEEYDQHSKNAVVPTTIIMNGGGNDVSTDLVRVCGCVYVWGAGFEWMYSTTSGPY
jgi:hypothetical protein